MEAMPTVSSSVEKLPQIPHISLTQRHQTIRHPEKCSKPENDAICGLAARKMIRPKPFPKKTRLIQVAHPNPDAACRPRTKISEVGFETVDFSGCLSNLVSKIDI